MAASKLFNRARVPLFPVQQKIAEILSAYDELIQNNKRRIRILEELARALYREWFGLFRFPGHENSTRVASSLGPIPRDWSVKALREITTKIGSGATPRGGKEAYKTEGINLIRSLNIYDNRFDLANLAFIDDAQAAQLENVAVEKNDILLNITGASVARCCMVPTSLLPARVNQHVSIIRAAAEYANPFYVLDAINSESRKAQLLSLAQAGATREALTKETISNFEIVMPPKALLDQYAKFVAPLHKQREHLYLQTENLRHTRDLLLPRLLSGQIHIDKGI